MNSFVFSSLTSCARAHIGCSCLTHQIIFLIKKTLNYCWMDTICIEYCFIFRVVTWMFCSIFWFNVKVCWTFWSKIKQLWRGGNQKFVPNIPVTQTIPKLSENSKKTPKSFKISRKFQIFSKCFKNSKQFRKKIQKISKNKKKFKTFQNFQKVLNNPILKNQKNSKEI